MNGKATLDGIVVPVVTDPAKLRSGSKQVTILTATGGVTQNGVRIALGGTPVVRYGTAATDANTLALGYTVDFTASDALRTERLASRNRSELGRALNAILSDDAPALSALANRLASATTAQAVAATLDAFSGEAAASAQQTAFAAQQAFTSTILRHVVGESRASGGNSATPYAVASLDPVAGPPANDAGVRVWVGGYGASNVLSGTDGQGSLHSQIAGALLGVDKWFDQDRMLGISVGGGAIDFSVADRASQGHATSLNLSAYGLARFGDAYLSGVLAYGNYATDLRRSALGLATRGSLSQDVFGGRAEVGWRRELGGVSVTPFAALQVDHLWQGSFTDTASSDLQASDPGASGLALRFNRTERTSVPLTLGGRVGSSFDLRGGRVLGVSAELGWVHEFNPQRSVTAAFAAAPNTPFRVLGVSASRDAAQVGLDAKLSLTRDVALLGNFIGQFSGVEAAIGGFGGLQVTW